MRLSVYEKGVPSLFTKEPESKMKRQVASTMQRWEVALEVRLLPQREVMRFVTWVFQRVDQDNGWGHERSKAPWGPGQAGPASPCAPPWGGWSTLPHAWDKTRRMLRGKIPWFCSPSVTNKMRDAP